MAVGAENPIRRG